MKIFWSWQSDTPKQIGQYLVRDALREAIKRLKQVDEIEDATREALHLDHDIKDVTGTPDLVQTIFKKIENSEVVVADVTIVGKTSDGKKCLINSNVGIELGYAWSECTDSRVIVVFNKHYGKYEELPFDLRHKGGAVVFNLAPEPGHERIEAECKMLCDDFVRKLRPFLEQPPRIKESLSLKAVIEHRLLHRHPIPSGGVDVFQITVRINNDGEQVATDFRLDLELPDQFVDGSLPYGTVSETSKPGFRTISVRNLSAEVVYPETQSRILLTLNLAIRDDTKRLHSEDLEKPLTAIVYSGNMKPKKTVLTISDLMR